jgi:hypothetical protein
MSCHSEKYIALEFVEAAWGFASPYPTINEKIHALREQLQASTVQRLADAASRQLDDFDYLEWRGSFCWDYGTPHIIPREFVVKLAACSGKV